MPTLAPAAAASSPIGRLTRRVVAGSLDRIDAGLDHGTIQVELPDGSRRVLGGRGAGPTAVVAIRKPRALLRLALSGSVGWYEAWEAGEWTSPDPVPLFDLFMRNRRGLGEAGRAGGPLRLAARALHALRRNNRTGSRRNIAAHYDLGNDFYREWLDGTLTYSSALFVRDSEPLEVAQQRKLDAALARLEVNPGDTILEIGSGWGSFAATASRAGIGVRTITLSDEQKAHIDALALPGVEVSLTDYRDVAGIYDGVASIEMVEAVGREYWRAYLQAVSRALKPGGRAAIQMISIAEDVFDAYARNVDFIQRYVFPGGMLVSEARLRALADDVGLDWTDREGFGASYAETLRRWRHRFDAADREGRLPQRLDRHFRDLWRYYLMYCEGGFRGGGIDVAQVTLVKR